MKSKRRKYEVALTFAVICATLAFLSISIGCVSAGSSFTQQNNNKSALSASWTTEAVDAPKYFTGFSQRAIAIDGFNRHISYYDYTNDDLKYATNASGSWVTSTIASGGDVGWYSSIAIDSNNNVHISYYDHTNGDLKYATDASGSWVTSTIDSVGCLEHHYISSSISIAIDSNNKVHIIYCDYANEALKYATNASGAWVTSTIDSEGEVLHSSIAIDSNNKVHISYRKYGSLKYATNASGAWVTSTIALGGRCTSIAIDSNNKVHISYYSTSTYSYYLKYATNASGSWVTSTIDWRTGSTYITGGSSSSIAIDSNNKVHISYKDLPIETLDLKYATDASGSWVTSTIDSEGSVGEYSSIAIDSNNNVHISYHDGTNGDLKYATDASGSWVTSTIDSEGSVGMHTSVDIDSNNNVHISYYDSTNKDLKYATNSVSYPAPDISVSPVSFDFGDKCEGDTDSTTFELWNSGTGTLTYSLSESCGWVEVNPTSGSSTGEHDTITVDIGTTGLSEGTHTCDIPISSNDGTGTFTVTVNVVPCPKSSWTFIIYLDGDNDLEEAGIDDFMEMSSVGSTSDVNIVVQFDRIPGYDSSYGDWTTCKRFHVTSGMTPTPVNARMDLGECNMGDPNTLDAFVTWAMAEYPADNYALVLWNHGRGWKSINKWVPWADDIKDAKDAGFTRGICWDYTNNDYLSLQETEQALTGKYVQLLGYDACLMHMVEVVYQVMANAGVSVGSEEVEQWDGWPYDTILTDLTGTPSMSPSILGETIVSRYIVSCAYGTYETQSAVDKAKVSNLASAVDTLAQVLIDKLPDDYVKIQQARNGVEEFLDPDFIDLYHFAELIKLYLSDNPAAVAAAQAVMDNVDNTVTAEGHDTAHPNAHGLSIYFPEAEGAYLSSYENTKFAVDTHWDEFLKEYYSPSKPDLIITEKWVCWPDNCTICYNVTNIGDGTAPECHNTALYVDDVEVAQDHVPVDLAPGESYTGCFDGYEWTYTPPSDEITVCADNSETLDELNEDNNCLTNIWMCGDVTGDGRVRTSDGRRIFRHLTFGDPIDNLWAADVTGDGRVRTSDGRRIFRHLTFGVPLNCNCSG